MVEPSYAQVRSRSTPWRAAALAVLALGLASVLAACGAAPPRRAAPATLTLIAQAEDAESQRRYDQARALYEQARRQAPDDPSRAVAARALGRALIFWGELGPAAIELDAATRFEPADPGTWHDLGMVRHRLGDVAGAERALGRAIELAPGDGRSRIALAALLWRHGRLREALDQYRALARIDLPERVRAKVDWAIRTLEQRVRQAP